MKVRKIHKHINPHSRQGLLIAEDFDRIRRILSEWSAGALPCVQMNLHNEIK
jgi:hypothetical protein